MNKIIGMGNPTITNDDSRDIMSKQSDDYDDLTVDLALEEFSKRYKYSFRVDGAFNKPFIDNNGVYSMVAEDRSVRIEIGDTVTIENYEFEVKEIDFDNSIIAGD